MPRTASATIPETALCEAAIKHVVNDYFVLLWAEWAQRQTDSYEDIVRTHIAFSCFLPHRAFGDFFGNSRSLPPRGVTDRDLDIHAIDFSDGNYVDLAWQEWEFHMNTHLFHLNYLAR